MDFSLIAGLIFVGVAAPTFVLLNRMLDPGRARLRRLASDPDPDRGRRMLPEPWALALASMNPRFGPGATEELEKVLRTAGYAPTGALQQYLAIRLLLILIATGTAGLLGAVAPADLLPPIAFGGLMAGLLAFSIPRAVISAQAKARSQSIARGLPLAMNLMAICLESGLDPVNSVRRVADAVGRAYPDLSLELRGVHRMAQYQSMDLGWRSLTNRVPTEEVRNLCSIMIQSEQVGSDAASALIEFSASYRAKARMRAEGQANRASFWMLFPTIGCLFIASAIILLGPVLYQFTTGSGNADSVGNIQKTGTDRLKGFRATPEVGNPRP